MARSSLQIADALPDPAEALDYEAPFVEEKLLDYRVVDTAKQARALFLEAKRYLVISQIDSTKTWGMFSRRVDEAWHQFILFTVEYTEFCDRYFGEYIHHCPSNGPNAGVGHGAPHATFAEFGARYHEIFGIDLPDLWHDSYGVTPQRRVLNDHREQLALQSADGKVMLIGPEGRAVLRVNSIAQGALEFIASTSDFYVRELPKDLTDEEKVQLVSTLVDAHLLRVC
jgi:hypothetical protein